MESHKNHSNLHDIILGGQDGLVNVLGVILGVSAATSDLKIIIISGLAATFAESISMAAVAYTSTEASFSQYKAELEKERSEIEKTPETERNEVRRVFQNWGFEERLLEEAVGKITSDKGRWVKFMMSEELDLSDRIEKPLYAAAIVGLSSLTGSFIPLLPFFLLKTPFTASYVSFGISALTLFAVGFIKAKETTGSPVRSGLKIAIIGMASAIVGYGIGKVLGG